MSILALPCPLRRLPRDTSGVALIEFALGLPVLLMVGGYGVELSNYALAQLRISQYALDLADNASRVGLVGSNGVTTLREQDINDIFQGLALQGASMNVAAGGRVTLSSLENVKQPWDTVYAQRLHWQRCFGAKTGTNYDSTYGSTTPTAGTDSTAATQGTAMASGMGDSGSKVNAPKDNGVMFVEINYLYQPLFGTMFMKPTRIHYSASLVVRDNRDYTHIGNPSISSDPSKVYTQMKCNAAWAAVPAPPRP